MALRVSVAAVFVGGCMTLFPAFAPVASADELQIGKFKLTFYMGE